MDHVTYARKRVVDLLRVTDAELRELEVSDALRALGGPREVYAAATLSAYRRALGRYPSRHRARAQLFLNFKGGTGKTSLSVSYAHRLAELGHRVLLVDLDSQGHASKCVGIEADECEHTLHDVLVKGRPIREVAIVTCLEELHLVPSNLRMSTVDLALMPMTNRERKLQRALDAIQDDYDFVVLDAPPSFGLLNLNAIIACQDLFVPVLPDFLSFHGLKLLFETLDDLEEDMDHRLDRIFVVINQYNPTTTIARAAKSALEQHYPEHLLPMVVRQCTKFAQASGEGVPIFLFDPSSKAAEDIDLLLEQTAWPPCPPAARHLAQSPERESSKPEPLATTSASETGSSRPSAQPESSARLESLRPERSPTSSPPERASTAPSAASSASATSSPPSRASASTARDPRTSGVRGFSRAVPTPALDQSIAEARPESVALSKEFVP